MKNKNKILVVDDTPASLKLLTDLLKAEGYEVLAAINGELALHAAAFNPPDLALLDIRMPIMDGYEVCRRIKANSLTRDIPVIFLSAASETVDKVQGFEVGAVDYITKPYQREELLARVHTHLELHHLQHHLELLIEERTAELRKSERNLRTNLLDSVTALAAIAEMRDPYTAGHQQRVAQLASAIAANMGLSENQIEGIHLAGVLHDVGKNSIPAEILSKPGKLGLNEFGLIKEHAQNGYEILKTIHFPWPIAKIVLQHHERLDGSGYPNGEKGEQILLEARIVAVADVVESMISHRPYRPGLGLDAALATVIDNKGTLFDPVVVDACVKLFRELNFKFSV